MTDDQKADLRQLLKKNLGKKFDTTMINALSVIETSLGLLWSHGKNFDDLTEDEKMWRSRYEDIRKKVLDVGNRQKKNCWAELDTYDFQKRKYSITFYATDIYNSDNYGNLKNQGDN